MVASAQIYPTNAQVFNFAVGDTFVYQVAYDPQLQNRTFEMMVVIARQDSGNSTKYTLQHSFNYNSLNSYLTCDTVLQIINQDTSIVSCYNAYYSMADGCFCVQGGITGPYYGSTSWGDSTLYFGGMCTNGGGGFYQVNAIKGLGVVYIDSYCDGGGEPAQEAQYCNLVYYHLTNGVIGGVANYYILGLPDLASGEVLIQLVPNPAYTQFEIKIEPALSEEADFKLFDALGNVLLNHKLNSNSTLIQRQNISSGIYFWQVDIGGKTVKIGNVFFE